MKLFLAYMDDRVGLYVNKKLKVQCETYELNIDDLPKYIGLPVTIDSIEMGHVDLDWLETKDWKLPEDLDEVESGEDYW